MSHPPLILASTSPYRRQLLERLALPFSVADPAVDERSLVGESPQQLVERLAIAKAEGVARVHPGAVVIGSDQVAVLDGEITGKPGHHEAAREQLRRASGREVVFHTGLCCYQHNLAGDHLQHAVIPYRVLFRKLSDEQIERYLHKEKPYDCAGSFKSEGLGVALFARMEGEDPSALMGLPLIHLTTLLEKVGVFVV
ncbi:MAG: septum formation inhibitor Maf [Magnetococcales bacterium]|nr:septum formation inhibitor Maf [Magnetococcales bacterium]